VSRVLVATNNHGKQAEFRRLLAPLAAEVVTPGELGIDLEVPEPHDSYAANATDKAVAFCRASGEVTLADDSGIEVAALGWGPGVRSARYTDAGGRPGPDVVLEQLVGAADRRARMVCWLSLAVPAEPGAADDEPTVELYAGTVEGQVTTARRGSGGFGYDPIFELPDGRTTAELTDAEKDRVSHRGRAVAAALPRLRELLEGDARMPGTAEDA
jgi:XTP/dITP diphosphohydrolase